MNNIDKFRSRSSRRWRSKPGRLKVSTKELQEIAEELVAVKDKIRALQETERSLKNEVFSQLESYEYLEVLFGKGSGHVAIIEKCKTTAAASLNRERVCRYMTSRYGSLAADELLEHCLVKKKAKETIYVRVFPNDKESIIGESGDDPWILVDEDPSLHEPWGALVDFDPLPDFDDDTPF